MGDKRIMGCTYHKKHEGLSDRRKVTSKGAGWGLWRAEGGN